MAVSLAPAQLRTARLLLRPFRPDDAEAVFAYSVDEEYARFVLPAPATRESVTAMLARAALTSWAERPRFAIVLDGCVVGDIGLTVDVANATAELGYGLARVCWGGGLATEAARSVVDYGFRSLPLAKVWARADPRNTASVRVLEKLGMTREGLLRAHLLRRGERVDRVYYGLLREEWSSGRAIAP
jgi:ribosomal-protein-alanine N-acetyltransferase